jgi:hypothetical protein
MPIVGCGMSLTAPEQAAIAIGRLTAAAAVANRFARESIVAGRGRNTMSPRASKRYRTQSPSVGGEARSARASVLVIEDKSCTCFLHVSQKRFVSDGFMVRQSTVQGDAIGISLALMSRRTPGRPSTLHTPKRVTFKRRLSVGRRGPRHRDWRRRDVSFPVALTQAGSSDAGRE